MKILIDIREENWKEFFSDKDLITLENLVSKLQNSMWDIEYLNEKIEELEEELYEYRRKNAKEYEDSIPEIK